MSRGMDSKVFKKDRIRPSEYPTDLVPAGGETFIGIDEGSPDGDCTVKGFYKDGEFHIQGCEHTGT